MKNVLVYGGTGSQARPTVMHLLKHGHTPVVVTRNLDQAKKSDTNGAKYVCGDLANFSQLKKINQNIDMVAFLLPAFLGNGDDPAQFGINAIDAAVAAGVRRFVWNASGPIPADLDDPKKKILTYLENSKLEWVVFEPTTYMENLLGPWTAPSVITEDELAYPVLDDVKIGWLASDDVGKFVVAAIEAADIKIGCYNISGIEAPKGPEIAAFFSSALSRAIKYRTMPPNEMGEIIDEAFGPGSGERIAEMYRAEQQDPNPEPKFHDMSEILDIFKIKMTTIEEWVQKHRNAFE